MSVLGVAHYGIYVEDLERVECFYRALGFVREFHVERRDSWVGDILGAPGAQIEVAILRHPSGAAMELLRRLDRKWGPVNTTLNHVALYVEDIRLAISAGLNASVHEKRVNSCMVSNRIAEIPDGANKGNKVVYLRDPEGNVVELIERAEK